ncbi:DNA-directed RNA polymerase II subunit RPB1-like [Homarus americanus]|uniref:DNA-directed RNA polymerase II subunit RPB1-like n=1 Tax=Homarus americanus TaxID=6706 RepID=UPI001C449C66|nr:DNA-directed RNA polymerase II subunit RPB1-like [Homarus americanus]
MQFWAPVFLLLSLSLCHARPDDLNNSFDDDFRPSQADVISFLQSFRPTGRPSSRQRTFSDEVVTAPVSTYSLPLENHAPSSTYQAPRTTSSSSRELGLQRPFSPHPWLLPTKVYSYSLPEVKVHPRPGTYQPRGSFSSSSREYSSPSTFVSPPSKEYSEPSRVPSIPDSSYVSTTIPNRHQGQNVVSKEYAPTHQTYGAPTTSYSPFVTSRPPTTKYYVTPATAYVPPTRTYSPPSRTYGPPSRVSGPSSRTKVSGESSFEQTAGPSVFFTTDDSKENNVFSLSSTRGRKVTSQVPRGSSQFTKLLREATDTSLEDKNNSFSYVVSSPGVLTSYGEHQEGVNFGHTERNEGYRREGRYFTTLPDGRTQVVHYYADETGYHPTITYI